MPQSHTHTQTHHLAPLLCPCRLLPERPVWGSREPAALATGLRGCWPQAQDPSTQAWEAMSSHPVPQMGPEEGSLDSSLWAWCPPPAGVPRPLPPGSLASELGVTEPLKSRCYPLIFRRGNRGAWSLHGWPGPLGRLVAQDKHPGRRATPSCGRPSLWALAICGSCWPHRPERSLGPPAALFEGPARPAGAPRRASPLGPTGAHGLGAGVRPPGRLAGSAPRPACSR